MKQSNVDTFNASAARQFHRQQIYERLLMKNSEFVNFFITKTLLNKKFIPILVVCTFFYFLFFGVTESLLICSNNFCRVENRTILNTVVSTKNINLSEIKRFSYYRDYNYLKRIRHSNSHRYNRFYILAETQTGKFVLFKKASNFEIDAKNVVRKLNNLLTQENVNATIRY